MQSARRFAWLSQLRDRRHHRPNFGRHQKKAMDERGIEGIHRMDTDYDNAEAPFWDMFASLKKQFRVK